MTSKSELAESVKFAPAQTPGDDAPAVGVAQAVAVIGVEVVPGIGQPKASKIPGLLPLLNVFVDTAPVPKI